MIKSKTDPILNECDKEPIHLLGKIQSHGVLLAFHKVTKRLTYISENAREFFKDFSLNSESTLDEFFEDEVIIFFDKLKKDSFNNSLYDNEVRIGKHDYLIFFSNSNDHIIIEFERQSERSSTFESFNTFKTISQSIKNCSTKENLVNTTAYFLKGFTGFDRIMIYQFDENDDGEVIAEEKSIGLDSFLGLKYPATDIPKQARKLYLSNLSRAINLIEDEGIPVQCLENKNIPLDLSYAVYRSVSPVHIQYLKNMGVTATHVVSIVVDNKLWGMLICHHYSGPKSLNLNSRFLLELVANQFSNKVSLLELENLRKHEESQDEILYSISVHEQSQDIESLIREYWLFVSMQIDACGFTIFDEYNKVSNHAKTPKEVESLNVLNALKERILSNVNKNIFYTDSLKAISGDWQNEEIAGCVIVVMSTFKFICFWREAKEQVINWAGNPEKAMSIEEKNNRIILTPRSSFDIWVQKEKGKSLPWLPHQRLFVDRLHKLLTRREINFYKNILEDNNKLATSGKRLKQLLENKTEELSRLNHQLQKELKENKKYQKELEIVIKTSEEINQLKSKVFSNISHEIRTPITSIIGITKIFLMERTLIPEHKELVVLILKSAERLLDTVDRVLQTSKIGKRNSQILIEYTEVILLTNSVISILKPEADQKNIRLVLINHAKELYAYIDQSIFSQIISSIISNAIKFTDHGGSIEVIIKLLREDDINFIYLSVEDNGIGIEESELEKIFEPYYTVNDSTFQADKSTGLGLYVVKNKLALLGGKIKVESTKGKGTIFKVLIPSKNE
jgi:light-regulated signal transduction histidine kinase (bacteriophytochrome)